MKPTMITTALVTAIASTAVAQPLKPRQLFGGSGSFLGGDGNGILGLPGDILGSAIDTGVGIVGSAACAISTFVSGRSRLCFNNSSNGGGNGVGITLSANGNISGSTSSSSSSSDSDYDFNASSSQTNNSYDFKYKSVGDKYEVTITPKAEDKDQCTEKYNKDQDIQSIIAKAAKDCFGQ